MRMDPWALPSLLAAALTLVLFVTVQLRRPPRALLPSLSAALLGAACFAAGDAITGFLTLDPQTHQIGLAMLYTGTLAIGPATWMLTLRFAEVQGVPFAWGRSAWTNVQ